MEANEQMLLKMVYVPDGSARRVFSPEIILVSSAESTEAQDGKLESVE